MSANVRCAGRWVEVTDEGRDDRLWLASCGWQDERPGENVLLLTAEPCPKCGGRVEVVGDVMIGLAERYLAKGVEMSETTNRELVDADTGEILGEATVEQAAPSDEAAKLDGGAGIILVDENGRVVPPDQEHQPFIGPTRHVYAAEPSEGRGGRPLADRPGRGGLIFR